MKYEEGHVVRIHHLHESRIPRLAIHIIRHWIRNQVRADEVELAEAGFRAMHGGVFFAGGRGGRIGRHHAREERTDQ
jgi:hypothetical protein